MYNKIKKSRQANEEKMFTITIKAIGHGNETEWTKTITSERSLAGAKSKATRWINKNLFASEIDHIEKDQVGPNSKQATWWVH